MAMKRANGTGSVYKMKHKPLRKPYRAVVTTGYDENGKCKKFTYDPLLRTPKKRPPLAKFTKEDFKL